MLKDAPILILDETTSALDSEVEAAIQENLYKGSCRARPSSPSPTGSPPSRRWTGVVMDRGRIVEEGSHDELIARGGLYA